MIPARLSVLTLGAVDLPRLRGFYADPEDNRREVAWTPWVRFSEAGAVID